MQRVVISAVTDANAGWMEMCAWAEGGRVKPRVREVAWADNEGHRSQQCLCHSAHDLPAEDLAS